MTDESAKQLAEAMNRLASVLEKTMQGTLLPGIHVHHSHHHHGAQLQPSYNHYPSNYPTITGGSYIGNSGGGQ